MEIELSALDFVGQIVLLGEGQTYWFDDQCIRHNINFGSEEVTFGELESIMKQYRFNDLEIFASIEWSYDDAFPRLNIVGLKKATKEEIEQAERILVDAQLRAKETTEQHENEEIEKAKELLITEGYIVEKE